MTPQDIAAAIGMIDNVLAREVFCAVWWPDGARLVWKQLDGMLAMAQFEEWKARADDLVVAQIAIAQAANDWRRYDLARARAMLARAKERIWPSLAEEPYKAVRLGVIEELRAPRICPTCNGRQQVKIDDLVVECSACGATGKTAVSDMQRARWLGRNESSYRRTWRPVYEWTYTLVANAAATGREEFSKRLDDAP